MMENLDENPCVGCGPHNPRGLRLAFEEEPGGVRARLDATPDLQGWPERLHSGVLYLALLETANWTVYARRARVGLPVATSALETRAWVATGETLTLRGREAEASTDARPLIEARAERPDGSLVARLTREFILPTREELMARLGYQKLPAVLEEVLSAP